jgi:hypothetical protein
VNLLSTSPLNAGFTSPYALVYNILFFKDDGRMSTQTACVIAFAKKTVATPIEIQDHSLQAEPGYVICLKGEFLFPVKRYKPWVECFLVR